MLSLAIAKSIHQFLELGSTFDLEEDFVVIVRHFDVKMLDWRSLLGLLSSGRPVLIRHLDGCRVDEGTEAGRAILVTWGFVAGAAIKFASA